MGLLSRVKSQVILTIMLGLLLAAISVHALASDTNSSSKTITIVDSANRTVEVPYPVERVVVLWSNPAKEMRALGAVDRIVGMDQSTKDEVDKGTLPELAKVPVVGTQEEPNYEKIAELKPDVVICLSAGYPPEPNEIQAKLEPFGIKVVGLDFYRTEVWFDEIEKLGKMLDKEKEATEYADFFYSYYDQVNSAISSIPDAEKKKVYFEGAKRYQTYGGAGYGSGIPNMIRASGGKDLYPEREELAFEVNPEDVAERNPDVIFKGTPLGWDAENDTEFKDLRDEIMNRTELASTNAVKNGQVYVISFDVAGGAGKKFGPVFLAKTLYPEKLPNLDPLAFYREYLQKFQGLEYKGVYLYP
ncbi:MAG: Cobalamin-binding protein precursor [Methanosaeta sp. PtaB.Bin018]|jgi:iron complex transport system substrate-binding protein|nr:MAG: Cobalamin-binding protein precursor [Methanosaeta sp. PtaB.Bin018]OPY47716.1 MAG: Cobalamin-binding protein precursor [Methanosaeta sp. PtaU1.Bin016]